MSHVNKLTPKAIFVSTDSHETNQIATKFIEFEELYSPDFDEDSTSSGDDDEEEDDDGYDEDDNEDDDDEEDASAEG